MSRSREKKCEEKRCKCEMKNNGKFQTFRVKLNFFIILNNQTSLNKLFKISISLKILYSNNIFCYKTFQILYLNELPFKIFSSKHVVKVKYNITFFLSKLL